MSAVSDAAKANRRASANARHRERYATDALYREACKARQKRQRKARAERQRERYACDPEFRKAMDQRRSQQRTRARIKVNDGREFVGCDGEGVGRGADSRYALFRMGHRELGPFKNDRRLTTPELLRFITAAPPEPIYVGFAFEYDISNILKDVPHVRHGDKPSRLDRIMRRDNVLNAYSKQGRWTWLSFEGYPVFGVNYLARNHLSVCIGEAHGTHYKAREGSTRTIYDVFGNFQSSFVNALEKWDFGFRHRETIERMKRQRNTFTTITQQIRDYCALECRLLGELMEDFRAVCLDADLRPKTWNGAGKLAAALHEMMDTITAKEAFGFTDKDGKRHPGIVPAPLAKLSHAAYYGGRFEITRAGKLNRTVFEHDIASAYPAAMLTLPCLRHGEWKQASGAELAGLSDDAVYLAPVRFSHPLKQFLCGLPIRDKQGSLSWPRNGNGIYWSCEIRSAQRLGAAITHRAGWRYVNRCDCKPFEKVRELYEYRKRIGKGRKGIPIKLAINSLYGKLAQRVGNPKFANPIWAGLITAITRAKINDAIRVRPSDVVMIATDGVYTINKPMRHLKPYAPDAAPLGGWELKEFPALFIVQPGLYWGPKPEQTAARKVRSRGVSASVFVPFVDQFEKRWADWLRHQAKAWSRYGVALHRPAVTITLPFFIGLRLAYHRNALDTACRWITDKRKISFDWSGKRGDMTANATAAVLGSLPGSAGLTSWVYGERGLEQPEGPQWWSRLELEAMPDGGAAFGPPDWG